MHCSCYPGQGFAAGPLLGGVSRPTPGGGPQAHNQEGGIPACTEADTPQTATAAGGTHPTGMHSCFFFNCLFLLMTSRNSMNR